MFFFVVVVVLVINVFHRGGGAYIPREAIGPNGSNRFTSGSIPVFLMKPIVTCNFPGLGCQDPLSPLWISPYRNAPKAEMMSMY